jgi:hypothetical protein
MPATGIDNAPRLLPEPVTLRPGLVALDWLTVNMRCPDPGPYGHPWQRPDPVRWNNELDPHSDQWGAYIVAPTDIRTSQFSRVAYMVNVNGEKVATISADPHNGALNDPAWIQVQFSNETLYTNEWTAIFRMFRAMGCEYTGISRVDIAADGIDGDGGDFPGIVEAAVIGGDVAYYGKGKWRPDIFRRRVLGFEFGTRSSNKFVRAYRKKREMKSKGVKPHICDAWLKAWGFDVWNDPREVNRFEVSVKGKEARRYFPGERSADWLLKLSEQGPRVDVFASMAPGIFDFRFPSKYARDAAPACVWDWSGVADKVAAAVRAERTIALTDHTIKTYLRAMYQVATVTGDASGYRACEVLARSAGPQWEEYYNRKKYIWAADHVRLERAKDPRTARILEAMRNDRAEMDRHAANLALLQKMGELGDA